MIQNTLNIITAERVGDYRIRLRFDDGVEQIVDFRSFLINSQHPDIRAWLNPARFANFRLEYGELVWGDYDLCFPIMDLYQNQLQPIHSLKAAA